MKKINYQLTADEKQALKTKRVSQQMLQDLAPDEIAAILSASPVRTREFKALAEFQNIPSLGVGFAKELIEQGYFSLEQLKGKRAVNLFDAFERHSGVWADPCVEDCYRLLVNYIETGDTSKRWWNFTAERKSYREKYGFPADRPKKAWYELDKYPAMKAFKELPV